MPDCKRVASLDFGDHVYARFSNLITDFPNRFLFYPLARLLLPLAAQSGVTPTQITICHMILALVGAGLVLFGTTGAFYLAFACFFLRAVFDCLDGVLARHKNMTSVTGRIMDEVGDSVAFLALCATMGIHISRTQPDFPVVGTMILLALGAVFNAGAWDFYRRKVVSALRTGRDSVINELVEKHLMLKRPGGTRLLYFGLIIEWFQIVVFAPQTIRYILSRIRQGDTTGTTGDDKTAEPESTYILERSGKASFKVFLLAIAFLCGDNVFFIFVLALLSSVPAEVIEYCLVYSASALAFGIVYINYFLKDLRAT